MSKQTDRSDSVDIDRLALSRAQHLRSNHNRNKINSDVEDEIEPISDWSESDRECCPLSDFESTSNMDDYMNYSMPRRESNANLSTIEKLPTSTILLEQVLQLNDSHDDEKLSKSSSIVAQNRTTKSNTNTGKSSISTRKSSRSIPLLPGRHQQTKNSPNARSVPNSHVIPSSSHSIRNRKPSLTNNAARISLSREITLNNFNSNVSQRKNSLTLTTSPCPSNEEQAHRFHALNGPSPISSHSSMNQNLVPRVYETKKTFIDETDYGRLTDASTIKQTAARNRQKWGTIVHPPFPLGYQQISPDHLTHVVERLSSPCRSRDRRTPVQTPSKRFLSVEETEALISRLNKVKTIRAPDPYVQVRNAQKSGKLFTNALKTNSNWKTVGLSA